MQESKLEILKECYPLTEVVKKESLGLNFKEELTNLLTKISKTEQHYVICINPNNIQQPNKFDGAFVLN